MKRILIALVVACGGHAHEDKPAAEQPAESFTQWTAIHELFVEHPPFVVGQKSALAAHATVLAGHAPLEVPVNYVARDFSQGKKIRFWRDAWPGYAAFFKYRWPVA